MYALGRNPDVLSVDLSALKGCLESTTNFGLVAINLRAIEVAVTCIDSSGDCFGNSARGSLPSSARCNKSASRLSVFFV
jgi:hypothetical protein